MAHSVLLALAITYLTDRQRRGELGPKTAATYRYALYGFADSFGARPLDQLNRQATERWLETTAHLSPGTRRLRLSVVKGFAEWCVVNGKVRRDFTAGVGRIPVPRAVPRDLTAEHFHTMFRACRDPREECILWVLYGCGLRCVEASRLDVPDYDPRARVLHVTGKGHHQREVPVPEPVHQAITRYLAWAGHGTGPLLRYLDRPNRLPPERITKLVGRVVARAGVKVRPFDGRSAHGLRAAAASDLLDQCEDPRIAQEFLGHQNIATTSRYLRRKKLESIRQANDARFALQIAKRRRIVAGDTGLCVTSEAS